MMSRAESTESFICELRIERAFRGKAEIVRAEVSYEMVNSQPVFTALSVDGVDVPISYAKHTDLLKAYAKHRSVDL